MGDGEFRIPNARFQFTLTDTPAVGLFGDATACLDCGMIWIKADPATLREKAARWMK